MRFRLLLPILAVWLALGHAPVLANPLAGGRAAVPDEAAVSMALLPEPLRGVVQGLNRVQADLGRRMTGELQEIREEGSVAAGAWLCLIAFVYGVLHAAGPGHGKLVVSSYFLANRARVMRGVLLSAGAALTQALAAILLVGVPVLLLDMARVRVLGQIRYLEMGSYGLMTAVGLLLLVRAVRGDAGCAHGHGGDACAHHHGPGDHGHDHHDHSHDGHQDDGGGKGERAGFGLLALAVGCRPCSGAVLVLLFALANDIVMAGLLAVLAMAVGVALTTSASGLIGIGTRRGLERLLAAHPRGVAFAERGMALAGALLITLVGGGLFLAASSGL